MSPSMRSSETLEMCTRFKSRAQKTQGPDSKNGRFGISRQQQKLPNIRYRLVLEPSCPAIPVIWTKPLVVREARSASRSSRLVLRSPEVTESSADMAQLKRMESSTEPSTLESRSLSFFSLGHRPISHWNLVISDSDTDTMKIPPQEN
jgi:hypothetical protein